MIAISKQQKEEWETIIVYLEKHIEAEKSSEKPIEYLLGEWKGRQLIYRELLSNAIVLPVVESWDSFDKNNLPFKKIQYPKGVIIKS